ncbi:MAG TPA: universal stress protein [Baekduia sp.]|uniref:universal stress protein n=1 Tax=Baekduia sp. TaxID=2600305 RepID=UPI002CC777F1|nr:universal stress protein [Baekduia sp.]HMJ34151.1 universal stress protein [Baekduia sp.]
MIPTYALVVAVATLAAGFVAGRGLPGHRHRARALAAATRPDTVRRILLPFTGASISRRAFDAAVRLARVEGATLMPCYLATVPLNLPLDAPLARQCLSAMTLMEVIEQRAAGQEVAVDARISRGRTYRDALRRELETESFDRVIVSATNHPGSGFSGDDLVWLLNRADAEVLILRPAPEDEREVSVNGNGVTGHF